MSLIKDEIMKQIQQKKQLEQLRKNQQQMSSNPVTNLGNNISDIGMKLSQNPIQGIANLGTKAQDLGNTLQTFGNTSPLVGGISKAAPVVGAATGALNVGSNLANGDYANAGLDAAATGAALMGGPIGLGVAAAAQIGKQLFGAQKAKEQKAMQQSMEEMQRSQQANEESLAGLQNKFQNDSEQAAQNMTLPGTTQPVQTLSKDIMSRINPNYTSSAQGSPTGFAAGINTPDDTQTLQNDQSNPSQNGGSNIDFAPLQPIQVTEGKNDGVVVDKDATNELAQQQGLDIKQSLMDRIKNNISNDAVIDNIKNGLGDFKAGYDDNSLHGFTEGDLANKLANNSQQPTTPQDGVLTGGAAQTKKTLMNRIGEAAGTGRRLMANPWVQAGIAGIISKADGGDIGDIAQAAYKYGTSKAMSDQYYKAIHPDAKVTPVFNTYGAEDYKAKAYNDFNQGRTMISRRDLIKLNNPTWSDAKIDAYISGLGIDGDEMISLKGYDSVQKANYNTGKLEKEQQKIDDTKEYRKGQLEVSKGRAAETARHNRVYEGQRGQSIANTKANNDRNYNFKVNQAEQKKIEAELKRRGLI